MWRWFLSTFPSYKITEVSNYLTSSMISKSSELSFNNIILYSQCVCKPEPPRPTPSPSTCKKMIGCMNDNQCGVDGSCEHIGRYRLCVCPSEPPPICKNGNDCMYNRHCGKNGFCDKKKGFLISGY